MLATIKSITYGCSLLYNRASHATAKSAGTETESDACLFLLSVEDQLRAIFVGGGKVWPRDTAWPIVSRLLPLCAKGLRRILRLTTKCRQKRRYLEIKQKSLNIICEFRRLTSCIHLRWSSPLSQELFPFLSCTGSLSVCRYLKEFRTQQCQLFAQHKCTQHRPFTCFHWHFLNQRRRRPVKKRDGSFNYSADIYCEKYDESTGVCPDGDE